LIDVIYETLKGEYPTLPPPDKITINQTDDTAYVQNAHTTQQYIPTQSPTIRNLYTLGTHNGNAEYDFTSLESTVTNAQALVRQLEPSIYIPNWQLITMRKILIWMIIIGIILGIILLYISIYCLSPHSILCFG